MYKTLAVNKNRKPKSSYEFRGKEYLDTRRKTGISYRYFSNECLNSFEFSSHLKKEDGVFCLTCVVFSM